MALEEVFRDEDLRTLLAYARLHYLQETRLAELQHLGEAVTPWVPR